MFTEDFDEDDVKEMSENKLNRMLMDLYYEYDNLGDYIAIIEAEIERRNATRD